MYLSIWVIIHQVWWPTLGWSEVTKDTEKNPSGSGTQNAQKPLHVMQKRNKMPKNRKRRSNIRKPCAKLISEHQNFGIYWHLRFIGSQGGIGNISQGNTTQPSQPQPSPIFLKNLIILFITYHLKNLNCN